MRVNMDSSMLADPRFPMIARDLGIPLKQVYGCMLCVWFAAYARRSEFLSQAEIDFSADIEKFAECLIRHGLADEEPEGIRLHGVAKRIKYLLDSESSGRSGGIASGIARRKANSSTSPAKGTLQEPSRVPSTDPSRNPEGSANLPSPSPSPSQSTLTTDGRREGGCLAENSVEYIQIQDEPSSEPAQLKLEIFEPAPKRARIPQERLEAVYRPFPRKEGKKAGMAQLERILKAADDPEAELARVERAVRNYAAQMQRENRDPTKIKHFSSFMSNWTDYEAVQAPPLRVVSPPVYDPPKPPPAIPEAERAEVSAMIKGLGQRLRGGYGGGE